MTEPRRDVDRARWRVYRQPGRSVELPFCGVYLVEADQFVSAHMRYDRMALLRQLRGAPERPGAGAAGP